MTGTYVYCIVRSREKPSAARAPAGVPGAGRPRLLAGPEGAWLVAADVPLDAYGAEAINARLSDLDWVAARAMGHEAIVEHFARRHDVVPLKLFTIFRTDARAVAHVRARRDLPAILKRIAGRTEWSVRVMRAAAERGAAAEPAGGAGAAAPGTRFLVAKKRQRDASRAAAAAAARLADEVYVTLSRVASGSVRKDGIPSGTSLLLDAAFLVSDRRRRRFAETARKLGARASRAGCVLSVTGPWPAYHFVTGP